MNWTHPASELYFGLPGQYIAWLILIVSLAAFGYTILKRLRLLVMAKADPRLTEIGRRVADLIKDGFLQRRQPRYLMAGVLHIIIFWGFVVLGLHSLDLVVSGLWPGYLLPFMDGIFGAIYNSVKDVFVLAVLVTCVVAFYRRAVMKPARYQDSHQFEAYLVLCLIAFLMLTDMFFEAGRLIAEPSTGGFFTAAELAKPVIAGLSGPALKTVSQLSYWLHILSFFFFLNLLPLSKHFHIITGLPNVFFKKLNQGAIKPPTWNVPDMDQLDKVGVENFHDFTWKHTLDFFSCTECGRCTDNCPANAIGRPLSPKNFFMKIRDFAYAGSSLLGNKDLENRKIAGDVIPDEEFWSCTTCGACEQECPVFIEYIDKMVELRRHKVLMESKFPPEIEAVFRNLETYGNSMGMGAGLRNDWARGLNLKTVQEDADIDLLYWVGCSGAFDTRVQTVAVSFARLLKKADVNFGILGIEENCCGDYARRTGNEYLFQSLAKKNIAALNKYNIKKIVVACPHGYNTLKNEYPQLGGNFEVIHSTEFILNLINEGKLTLSKSLEKKIAYHDPCYLGRHNGIFEAPRRILAGIPEVRIVEAEKSRDKSFCCGAGGGHYWMESSGLRMNDVRTDQILETSPDMITTSCPYCLIMIEDGLESKEMKGQIQVKDIIEVISELI